MYKLLLHGQQVDLDMYDWKTDNIRLLDLPCDLPEYAQLIQMCFDPSTASAPLVAALSRSISIHHFTERGHICWSNVVVNEQLVALEQGNLDSKIDSLLTIGLSEFKDDRILQLVVTLLHGSDVMVQRHAMAVVATLPPQEIYTRVLKLWKSQDVRGLDVKDVHEQLELFLKALDNGSVIAEHIDKNMGFLEGTYDEGVFKRLLELLHAPSMLYRKTAAQALRKSFQWNQKLVPVLTKALEKERHPTVRMEIVTSLSYVDPQ